MKSLKHTVQESLRIGINDKPGLCPEDWQELKDIIDDNCEFMFGHCTSLEFVDMKNWKPKKFINVKDMFLYCRSFGSGSNIDVSNWEKNDLNMKILIHLYTEAINPKNEIIFPNWFKIILK